MPSRYVREGWLDSDRIRMVGDPAEVLLLRLLLVADDYATFDGRLTVIQRRCWPAGDEEPGLPSPSVEEIEKRLVTLASKSLVIRYEIAGKPYLYIPNFQQRTRAKKSKYPMPPENARQLTDKGPTDDGHTSGTWRTPDGHVTDSPPTHDGGPQAVSSSSSSSGFITNNQSLKERTGKPGPVDKSTRKVQGGLTTSIPITPQPPKVNGSGTGLKPPAAMTPTERAAAGIADPPHDLMARYRTPTREPGEDDLEHDLDEVPITLHHPTTAAPKATPPPDWEETPEGIDQAGNLLGMKRLPFEDDPDFAKRIGARIALG